MFPMKKTEDVAKLTFFIIPLHPMSGSGRLAIIADGWKNLIFPSPEVKAIAKKRAEICAQCPFFTLMADKIKRGAYCGKCLCPIAAKVRARGERCPEGRWGQELKQKP